MSVTITKPSSGAELKGTATVEAVYSGQRFEIATVTFDGQQVASDASLPVSVAVDTTKVADGAHTLTVAVRYKTVGGKTRWQKAAIPVTVKNGVAPPPPPPPPPPPAVPGIPSGLATVAGDGKVALSWSANPAAEAVDGYQVYVNDAGTPVADHIAGLSYTAAGLTNGTAYSFRVSAHNAAGYGDWSAAISATPNGAAPPPPPPPPPPPSNRFTDINFAAGKYDGEGWNSVFEAYQSDPRLATWGGQDPINYDNYGMTKDQNQRVYLFDPASRGLPRLPGTSWASWQELRSTDGPWESTLQAPNQLAKSSLSTNQAQSTWGSGGFQVGAVRWWAWDILFPLNINGVSFEFVNKWHTTFDLHASSGVDGDPCLGDIRPYGGNPRYLAWTQTPDSRGGSGVPYLVINLLQLTNSDGSRFTANYNKWHEVIVGMKASKDSSGWYELWVNGAQVAPQTQRVMLNGSEQGPYVQAQNYTQYPISFVGGATRGAIVYGGFRAGMNRADVQTR